VLLAQLWRHSSLRRTGSRILTAYKPFTTENPPSSSTNNTYLVMILPQVHLRNGFLPAQFPAQPDYILSRARGSTHFHLVCERSPYLGVPDVGASLRITHCRHPYRLLPSPTTLLVGASERFR